MRNMTVPVTIAIVGCGNRGNVYASYALAYPDQVKLVAVADPNLIRRSNLAIQHGIVNDKYIADDWRKLAQLPKFCDGIVICTQDRNHLEPSIAFSNLKYHLLLEKPMSNELSECYKIYQSARKNEVMLAVGHVLRYTPINKKIKLLLQQGAVGNIVSIQHLEPVGYHHFTHSFVRGNWSNQAKSSFILMAKTCHDIDLLCHYLDDRPWTKVSSIGSLNHFKKEKKPVQAKDSLRCLDCDIKDSCSASAKTIYLDGFESKDPTNYWMVDRITDILDIENITKSLTTGPYGRCVYECDNDVCDNQIVTAEFEGGVNVSMTMVAFTELMCQRQTTIFGDKGELKTDGKESISVYDFSTRVRTEYDITEELSEVGESGHGGGDFGLMEAFVKALRFNDPSYIQCDAKKALESHKLVFAAEHARLNDKVIMFQDFSIE